VRPVTRLRLVHHATIPYRRKFSGPGRVWLRDDMTIRQVAKVYGATAGEVDRMLRKI
jgi:hypothetical protein